MSPVRLSLFRIMRSCRMKLWVRRPLISLYFHCAGSADVDGLRELIPRSIEASVWNRFGSRVPVVRTRINNWSNSPEGFGKAVGSRSGVGLLWGFNWEGDVVFGRGLGAGENFSLGLRS